MHSGKCGKMSNELELNANESRIEGISNKGKELIDADHYEKESIESLLEDINELWKDLNQKADEKGRESNIICSCLYYFHVL